ncbi:thiamine pyrophosphate-binding protein [Sphingomonas nostoxanthinifaciens]|uniref:thiamine pyrophosphate-binding protein n=1 Tax=Sphingomonas nostoxanthinifaciens TaxID=2872652 RepID=UPI001CC208C9|nr:thiamine pyrophosphate-binding protein [Sphingomonas nostoxanthinifaciens]UAK26339.1 pyruvate dehydrogenase [Sphingomonas nostoxanthinifaciens]
MSQNVAELLVDTLARIGVRQIFGIVGDALNPFTDALRRDGRIQWIGVRHEEGAALAAAGQAKLTGQLGVCCGTTGPGANHLVAGLYEARKDHAPVLAISGHVPTAKRGTDYLQEDDPVGLFADVAVYSQLVAAAEQAPAVFQQAIAAAYGERGVAHLSVPPDVFAAKAPGPVPSLATLRPRPEIAPSPADIGTAQAMIAEAKTIAVFCGHGCHGAAAELAALSDRLHAPLTHTYRGKDIMPYDDPRWMGGVGLIGGRPGVDALHDADLMLMLGTDYPYSEFLPKKGKVVQIDERANALGRRTPIALGVVGSVAPALRMLLDGLPQRADRSFFDRVAKDRAAWDAMLDKKADPARSGDKIHPQAVARLVSDHASSDAVIVTDTGEVTLWAANWTRQRGTQRHCGSFNNAAVGTGLGIANGIQALDRTRQVVLHAGDGGFTMLLGEFMTTVEHKLPVKVVVYDNGGWGLVHLEMEGAGVPAAPGAMFPNLDFAAFARACGAEGFTARQPETLADTVRAFLAAPGPAILHAVVDPAEIPTMPHIEIGQAWRFGIAKVKEKMLELTGG